MEEFITQLKSVIDFEEVFVDLITFAVFALVVVFDHYFTKWKKKREAAGKATIKERISGWFTKHLEMKEEKLLEKVTIQDLIDNKCDGWNHEYSDVVIIGAKVKSVIDEISKEPDWSRTYYNFEVDEKGIVTFTAYRKFVDQVCNKFRVLGPDVIVYASMHWDFDEFATVKGDKDNHDFVAKFINDTPREYDPEDEDSDEWDVDVEITDSSTGYTFCVGGGMCEPGEKEFYEKLVKEHGPDAIEKRRAEEEIAKQKAAAEAVKKRASKSIKAQSEGMKMTKKQMEAFIRNIGGKELYAEKAEIAAGKLSDSRYLKAIRVTLIELGYDTGWVNGELRTALEKAYL